MLASHRPAVLTGGVVAGIIGGAVMSLFMTALRLINGQEFWAGMKTAAYPFIGDTAVRPGFDAGPIFVGITSHFAVSIVWGIAFAWLAAGMSRKGTLLFGAAWGIIVWLGMYYAVLPFVGAGDLVAEIPATLAIIQHLIFGVAVAFGFMPYQGRRFIHAHA